MFSIHYKLNFNIIVAAIYHLMLCITLPTEQISSAFATGQHVMLFSVNISDDLDTLVVFSRIGLSCFYMNFKCVGSLLLRMNAYFSVKTDGVCIYLATKMQNWQEKNTVLQNPSLYCQPPFTVESSSFHIPSKLTEQIFKTFFIS